MKRAGKRTVRPERVIFGGSVRVLSAFAGALLGWAGGLVRRAAWLVRRAAGLDYNYEGYKQGRIYGETTEV